MQDLSVERQTLPKQPVDPSNTAFEARRAKLVASQRVERDALLQVQETQRIADLRARQAQLPTGLRGLLLRATGQYQQTLQRFEDETNAARSRDRAAQHALVLKHLAQRQALTRDGQQHGLSSAFLTNGQSDPKQALVLRDDVI